MGVLIDTSALLAFLDRAAPEHEAVAALIEAEREPMVVSPFVLAELDHLVAKRLGDRQARAALNEMLAGAYDLASYAADDLRAALAVLERFADRGLGLTDASIVVLADRLGIKTVFTLDRRDFEGLVRSDGTPLTILP